MNLYQTCLNYSIEKHCILNSTAYIGGYARNGYDISWSNIFDKDIYFSYEHVSGAVSLNTSEWLATVFPDEKKYTGVDEAWYANFKWNRVSNDVNVIVGHDTYIGSGALGNSTNMEYEDYAIEFNFKYPLSEEQYFQRSTMYDIPLSLESLNQVMEGMKIMLVDKDDDILSWLRG